MPGQWFNSTEPNRLATEFLERYPNLNQEIALKVAEFGGYDDFVGLCNFMYVHQYGAFTIDGENFDYKFHSTVIDALNRRIYRKVLGEYYPIYGSIINAQERERWGGDQLYQLFSCGGAPFNEARAIIALTELVVKYFNKPLTPDSLERVSTLFFRGDSSELYVEDTYSFDIEIPSQFKEANRRRKAHVNAWKKFAKHLWEHEWEEAYKLVQDYELARKRYYEKKRSENQ